jgi:hypothetical protein
MQKPKLSASLNWAGIWAHEKNLAIEEPAYYLLEDSKARAS